MCLDLRSIPWRRHRLSSTALEPPGVQILGTPQGIVVFVFLGGGGDGPAFLLCILHLEDLAGDVARPPHLIRPMMPLELPGMDRGSDSPPPLTGNEREREAYWTCLLYTSDAADE